ncbi:transglycosylase SLT domain-containing protein [Mycobacterium fragae]|uniref:transglycosylase SLT domain-containing protein n=1 Tax=Mycobacterium fragae TaxID=1260918 RepID=UPI00111C5DA6|nr:transglycosylase SLT domain-containing protein [Mycobacterium fragae]MCV7398556.1 transglycosylase SLT domain-containing protein [Mycobacterium fragae]
MTVDPLTHHALQLLARGYNLYAGQRLHSGLADPPEQLRHRAERLTRVSGGEGMDAAARASLRTAAGLQRIAATDTQLAAVLASARADHTLGRQGTRRVLDDAHADPIPAADTPLGRQEALRRMAVRLRRQRQYVRRSQHNSHLLTRRIRAIRYEKSFTPGHVRQRIAAALDRRGISDPAARRNWLRGYETLIARESGGRPDAVGPGSARGIAQTIPATFAHYHQPGTSTNIYDPVANICASMNYVIHRYGVSLSGDNLAALVQQADPHRPPKGY